jgi:hypothetical protein
MYEKFTIEQRRTAKPIKGGKNGKIFDRKKEDKFVI